MSQLAQARREEAQAITALLIEGQDVRRVLSELIAHGNLPAPVKARAMHAVKQHLAASRRYAEASAARAIARQRPILRGQESETRDQVGNVLRGVPKRRKHAGTEP